MPDFKTIANFRKDNGEAIRKVCRQFVLLCRQLDLFTEAFVAIDGSKFKAVNNRDRNFTSAKLQKRMEQIEASIERYLGAIETADREESALAQTKTTRLKDKIAVLKEQMQKLKAIEGQLQATPDKQIRSPIRMRVRWPPAAAAAGSSATTSRRWSMPNII